VKDLKLSLVAKLDHSDYDNSFKASQKRQDASLIKEIEEIRRSK
jgi:hypothetical protein